MYIQNKIILWLQNEKKEIKSIIKAFWVEHELTDLLIISLFLILIFLVGYQAYHETSQSHVTINEYLMIKKEVNQLMLVNKAQAEALKEQQQIITQLSAYAEIDPVKGTMLLLIGGFIATFVSSVVFTVRVGML